MPSSNDDGALAAAASAAGVAGGPCSSPNDSLEGGSPGTTERRQRSETSSNGVDGKRQHRISSSLTIPAETKTPVSKRAKVAEAEAECEGNSVVTPTCCPRVRDDDPHTPHDGMEDGADRRRSKPEKQVGEEEAKRRAEGRHEFAKNLLKTEARELTIPSASQKRSDYLSWDEYFMAVAFLSALRSKDPNTQVGACIVNADRRIVGIGYNGFPRNCCDDLLPWSRRSRGLEELHTKYPYMCHAEMNAIMNKCSDDVVGAAMYVALFPCNECAKLIVQSGIREVVYMNYTYDDPDSDECRAARVLFGLAGVRCRRHIPRAGGGGGENNRTLTIDFGEPAVLDWQTVAVNSTTTAAAAATGRDDEKEEKAERSRRQRMVELLKREAGYDADDPPCSSSPSFGRSDISSSVVRSDHLPWDTYFMAVAFLSARRSKDPNTQVGACIVNADRRIVAVGYNGFPRGCSDDVLPWSGRGEGRHELHTKYPYVCHAEMNAILNKCSANVRGATIYVALFPCNDCAKLIIQAGIREVVYVSNKYHDTDGCSASRIMFTMAGVEVRQHRPAMRYIHLELRPPNKSSPCKDESD